MRKSPAVYNLNNNYRNPLYFSTKTRFSFSHLSNVVVKVFDILDSEIKTLIKEGKSAGTYKVIIKTGKSTPGGFPVLSSGVYFYQLKAMPVGRQAGDFIQTKKMILMK